MERSLVLIKPDAMERGLGGEIIGRLQKQGLKLLALKMLHLDKEMAGQHYAVHQGKPFFNDLLEYITSTPIIASVFQGRTPSKQSGRRWELPTLPKPKLARYEQILAWIFSGMPPMHRIRRRPHGRRLRFFSARTRYLNNE